MMNVFRIIKEEPPSQSNKLLITALSASSEELTKKNWLSTGREPSTTSMEESLLLIP